MAFWTLFVVQTSQMGTCQTFCSTNFLSLWYRPRNWHFLIHLFNHKGKNTLIHSIWKLWKLNWPFNILPRILYARISQRKGQNYINTTYHDLVHSIKTQVNEISQKNTASKRIQAKFVQKTIKRILENLAK